MSKGQSRQDAKRGSCVHFALGLARPHRSIQMDSGESKDVKIALSDGDDWAILAQALVSEVA